MARELKVALDALSDDAQTWHQASVTLRRVCQGIDGLALSSDDFSWAGSAAYAAYCDVVTVVGGYLADGVQEAEQVAHALRGVRAEYERRDGAVSVVFARLWEPA